MKNICLITHHPFWKENLGCGSLLRARYHLFTSIFDNVFVLFVTNTEEKCPLSGGTLKIGAEFTLQAVQAIQNFVKANQVNVCYFSYDKLGVLNDYLSCLTIVEIHDVVHLRQQQFEKYGYTALDQIDKKDELESLKKYNYVLSLNTTEVQYLKENGLENVIYFPPNINFTQLPEPAGPPAFGLIASMAKPNLDGFSLITKFLNSAENFVIAGPISTHADVLNRLGSNCRNLGIIGQPREFYEQINLAISPVRFGAGLKIKVFESLSYGRSVLATKHSIEGFPNGIDEVVTVVDNLESWDIDTLSAGYEKKSHLVQQYFLEHFNNDVCASTLRQLI